MKKHQLPALISLVLLITACSPQLVATVTPAMPSTTSTLLPANATPSPTITLPLVPAASSDTPITLASVSHIQLLRTLDGHANTIYGLAFSQDGRFFASSTLDGNIQLWDRTSWQIIREFQASHVFGWRLFFLADSAYIASGNGMVWDVSNGELEHDQGKEQTVALSPDGIWMAAVGRGSLTIELWRMSNWQMEREIATSHIGNIFALAFSPDSRLLATAANADPSNPEFTIKLWDVAAGQELFTLRGHEDAIHGIAFSPDGRWLASASMDTTVIIWDVQTGQAVHTLQTAAELFDVAFSSDSSLVAAALNNKTVELWSVSSGELVRTLSLGGEVASVAFSPDGTLLACGAYDRHIYLWGIP
jgi:WD40 repeat protein